jgi:hypothetical protein
MKTQILKYQEKYLNMIAVFEYDIYDNIKRKQEKIKRKIKREISCEPFVFFIKTIKHKTR